MSAYVCFNSTVVRFVVNEFILFLFQVKYFYHAEKEKGEMKEKGTGKGERKRARIFLLHGRMKGIKRYECGDNTKNKKKKYAVKRRQNAKHV